MSEADAVPAPVTLAGRGQGARGRRAAAARLQHRVRRPDPGRRARSPRGSSSSWPTGRHRGAARRGTPRVSPCCGSGPRCGAWSNECYLAELYVVPGRRGGGLGPGAAAGVRRPGHRAAVRPRSTSRRARTTSRPGTSTSPRASGAPRARAARWPSTTSSSSEASVGGRSQLAEGERRGGGLAERVESRVDLTRRRRESTLRESSSCDHSSTRTVAAPSLHAHIRPRRTGTLVGIAARVVARTRRVRGAGRSPGLGDDPCAPTVATIAVGQVRRAGGRGAGGEGRRSLDERAHVRAAGPEPSGWVRAVRPRRGAVPRATSGAGWPRTSSPGWCCPPCSCRRAWRTPSSPGCRRSPACTPRSSACSATRSSARRGSSCSAPTPRSGR